MAIACFYCISYLMYIFGFKELKKLVKLKIDPNEIKEEEN